LEDEGEPKPLPPLRQTRHIAQCLCRSRVPVSSLVGSALVFKSTMTQRASLCNPCFLRVVPCAPGGSLCPAGRRACPTGRSLCTGRRCTCPTGRPLCTARRLACPTERSLFPAGRLVCPTGRTPCPRPGHTNIPLAPALGRHSATSCNMPCAGRHGLTRQGRPCYEKLSRRPVCSGVRPGLPPRSEQSPSYLSRCRERKMHL